MFVGKRVRQFKVALEDGVGVPSSGLGESSTCGVQIRRPGALAREEEEVRVRRPMPTH